MKLKLKINSDIYMLGNLLPLVLITILIAIIRVKKTLDKKYKIIKKNLDRYRSRILKEKLI